LELFRTLYSREKGENYVKYFFGVNSSEK
jgi:hypothetical protein